MPDQKSDGEDKSDASSPTAAFVEHRELLFSIVYSILGTVSDTEDVLQETWLAWDTRNQSVTGAEISHPRAYLVRIAVNTALARQAAVRSRRETYVAPWLPEPLVDETTRDSGVHTDGAVETTLRAESVSMALLVVLESLTPLERAVFVLHEVFGYGHAETAEILGRSHVSVRQLAHRAREHVEARRPRYAVEPRLRQQVTERFLAAAAGGDVQALLELLAPDVILVADGGGKAPAAGQYPILGQSKVARALAAGVGRFPGGLDIRHREVNGVPSAVFFRGDAPFAALSLDLSPDSGQISGIFLVSNPDKLAHVR
ncbi:sigma-70 family RNA polymerase sigma factor [Kribbella sp. NPDC003505]|uniref:sigma-70 family RNA polymerase sigma factor n=1 Tax=Kribbella sp. NPDC003505 TaxID=3154448 RepID=UPI0033AADD87